MENTWIKFRRIINYRAAWKIREELESNKVLLNN